MASIRHPGVKALANEYDAKYAEWLNTQTPLALSTDRLSGVADKMQEEANNRIYARMNPFQNCGKFDLRFMEETFGYTDARSMWIKEAFDYGQHSENNQNLDSQGQTDQPV